jgi:hypothetical protein
MNDSQPTEPRPSAEPKLAWERPVLRRLDALSAEAAGNKHVTTPDTSQSAHKS